MHFHSELEDVVQTFALGLCFDPIVTPNISVIVSIPARLEETFNLHSVPPDEHRAGIRVRVHRRFETARQVFLEGRILDDGYPQLVVIAQHSFTLACWDALDLLNGADFETCVLAERPLDQQCHQYCPLRMGVYATSRPLLERR